MCALPKCEEKNAPDSLYCFRHTPEEVAKRRKQRFAEQDKLKERAEAFRQPLKGAQKSSER